MTRDRKPSKKSVRPASKSAPKAGGAASNGARPTGNRSKTDGKLHIQPGSFRKPKTDSRPKPASRRGSDDAGSAGNAPDLLPSGGTPAGRTSGERSGTGHAPTGRMSTGRTYSRTPGKPRQRGPQLDTPPSGATYRDRDGKTHSFPDSALKRIAAQILVARNKKWRYRPFGFPIFSASGSEQEMHFDFYVYDNLDSIFKLVLLMPRESREVWDRVGRFKQQYPMYSYELWTPEYLAKIMGPNGTLGW